MEPIHSIGQIGPVFRSVDPAPRETQTGSTDGRPISERKLDAEVLSQAERQEVEKLQRRDREVKAHEQAHKASAGQYAKGAASFDYQTGPDGKRYAVGGEVSIDIGKEADPGRTLEKAQTIRRAALAPADPSGQDRQIAMQATRMAAEARQELMNERMQSVVSAALRGSDDHQPASAITATGKRALDSIKAIESATLAAREDPFDHFI